MGEEAVLEKYLVDRVWEENGEIRKVKWIGHNSAPDRRVMLPYKTGRIEEPFWVELKAPGKSATHPQKREHARMRRLGETVFVVNSVEQIDRLMERGYV